jgi:hypothetical protein
MWIKGGGNEEVAFGHAVRRLPRLSVGTRRASPLCPSSVAPLDGSVAQTCQLAPCSMPFFAAITAAKRARARSSGLVGSIGGACRGLETS